MISRVLLFAFVGAVCLSGRTVWPAEPVIVHEWGTFTSLQDDDGRALGAVNVDDEPVPSFVYAPGVQVAAQYSSRLGNFGLPPYSNGKGWTPADPSVTMRLETPVLYFYPPAGTAAASIPTLEVHVAFNGGVLSQFYPFAELKTSVQWRDALTDGASSSLTWRNVTLGVNTWPRETDEKVWTTPREVGAAMLQVNLPAADAKQYGRPFDTERFLFYRGVGHLDAPLKVVSAANGDELAVEVPGASATGRCAAGWLVEINDMGKAAFRPVAAFGAEGVRLPADFAHQDFSAENLEALKAAMHAGLVSAGLYADEASAMLRTWQLSYFRSPGRRFFYLVPSDWVNQVLPLRVTGASTRITRVMVGRIELITTGQRAALTRLAAGPCPNFSAVRWALQVNMSLNHVAPGLTDPLYRGEEPLPDFVSTPPLVRDYLSMGRFRDALILDAQAKHSTPALAQLIKDNHIGPEE